MNYIWSDRMNRKKQLPNKNWVLKDCIKDGEIHALEKTDPWPKEEQGLIRNDI
jgi:hypothetical protein